jgi:hypothetical protein
VLEHVAYLLNVANGSSQWTGGYQQWLPFYNMDWTWAFFFLGAAFLAVWYAGSKLKIFDVGMLKAIRFFAAIDMVPQLATLGNMVFWMLFPLGVNPSLAIIIWVFGLLVWFTVIWKLTEEKPPTPEKPLADVQLHPR